MNFIFVFGYMNMIIFSYQQQGNDDFISLHHYRDVNGILGIPPLLLMLDKQIEEYKKRQ